MNVGERIVFVNLNVMDRDSFTHTDGKLTDSLPTKTRMTQPEDTLKWFKLDFVVKSSLPLLSSLI
jgi:hypothetical protein